MDVLKRRKIQRREETSKKLLANFETGVHLFLLIFSAGIKVKTISLQKPLLKFDP